MTGRQRPEIPADRPGGMSSPASDRPLTKPDHYGRFVGGGIRLRARRPIEDRHKPKGEVLGADEHVVTLASRWGTVTVPYDHMRRCNLIPEPVAVGGGR